MKVEDKTIQVKSVGVLSGGDVFEDHGSYYLKTICVLDGDIGCVSLRNGLLKYFDPECHVTQVNAKVVIE